MTSHFRRSLHVRAAIFVLVSAAALSSQLRVCETYADHKGRSHFGFHCPRLSDNRTLLFCCYHNNTAFKYCCNETEFRGIMDSNASSSSSSNQHTQNDYTAVIGVWVYGFFVLALILVDFLYYAAVHSELCRDFLVNWGLGGPWLTQAQSRPQSGDPPAVLRQAIAVKALVCSSCLDPPCHRQQEPQELKPSLGTEDQHRPDT